MCCNLFSSPIFRNHVLTAHEFTGLLIKLLSTSFLDDEHSTLRTSATALAFNIAAINHKSRVELKKEGIPSDEAVELLASLFEVLGSDTMDKETTKKLVTVVGLLVYLAPEDAEILDLCRAMDAEGLVKGKKDLVGDKELVHDIGKLFIDTK